MKGLSNYKTHVIACLFTALTTFITFTSSAFAEQTLPNTSSQILNSKPEELVQAAKEWGLSTEEYERYLLLMVGLRGVQSPGLDPLTALGIEAKDDDERKKFAEQWVKQEFLRTEKELKFQREVDAAWKRFNITPVIMGSASTETLAKTGRLVLFVKADDCSACETAISKALTEQQPTDIYLVDSKNDDRILQTWAVKHQILEKKTRERLITLNHDKGRWAKFGHGLMPALLQQEGSEWRVVSY
ncbi:TIGR03759 family integrating conjugative element protein [Rouxiella badensis]|uniref:TIGR03759 family integrating conjugative element protein n=1 Tax=Rouxiella badensis TaxID=1646377 RepID=UPI001D1397CF|nr:TIGR03759 family integrating conjugative element protein [Rouxiella badensis]MCC3701655.1 TIGR03759 family integrating conjugative element protein [Rouxiella badensis]